MQPARPVSFLASGGWPWRLLQTLLWAAAVAAVSVWAFQALGWPVAWAAVPVSKVLVLAWVLLRPRPLRLAWDGRHWQLQADSAAAPRPGQARVMLDLPGLMLLHWRADASAAPGLRSAWVAVARAELGPDWSWARVALFHPSPDTGTPQPPAA